VFVSTARLPPAMPDVDDHAGALEAQSETPASLIAARIPVLDRGD
jgi:hypothetical protein